MITIYHNPKCSKSRETLALLEDSGQEYEIIEYLKTPISKKILEQAFKALGMKLVRVKESEFQEYKAKNLASEAMIELLIQNPKLMERPLLISSKGITLGRPPENLHKIL